jgi:hypothetical protein
MDTEKLLLTIGREVPASELPLYIPRPHTRKRGSRNVGRFLKWPEESGIPLFPKEGYSILSHDHNI